MADLEMDVVRVLKYAYATLFKLFIRTVYLVLRLFNKQNDMKVIFVQSRSYKIEGNIKFIYNELIKKLPNAEIHFVNAKNKMNLSMLKDIKLISNAKYLILDDYYLPIYMIKPTRHLKVIQLWHAAGAFKKFGYSTVGTKFGPNHSYLKVVPVHSHYTHVYVSTKNVIQDYAEAFNMSPSHIFPYGIPRADLFSQQTNCEEIKRTLMKKHSLLNDKEMVRILVAPTYRADGKYGETDSQLINIFLNINFMLCEETVFIFKAHPYTNKEDLKRLAEHPNIIIADNYTLNEWMLVSDAFITDYSSAIFEYALLEKPLAHFVPDINEYSVNRGFYSKLDIISDGSILNNEHELIEWLNNRKRHEYFDTSRMVDYNFDYTQNVSCRIVSHFINN